MNKVKRIALAVALTGAVIGVAAPAAQATGGCVSRSEFRRVHMGTSVQRVTQIYGTSGHVSLRSGGYVIRDYRTCTSFHVSNVSFQNGSVIGKLYI
jgi:hypothetical protein